MFEQSYVWTFIKILIMHDMLNLWLWYINLNPSWIKTSFEVWMTISHRNNFSFYSQVIKKFSVTLKCPKTEAQRLEPFICHLSNKTRKLLWYFPEICKRSICANCNVFSSLSLIYKSIHFKWLTQCEPIHLLLLS